MDYTQSKQYFRLKDLPEDQRPREKVVNHGVGTLSDGELLALIIAVGSGKKNAVMLGNEIITQNKNLFELSRKGWKHLAKTRGIGLAKAIKLEAVFELSRRINARQIEKKERINGPADVFRLFRHKVSHLKQEILQVIVLNSRNEIIAVEEISRGLVNSTSAHPREIFNRALENLGVGIILLHNHPTQNSSPSEADKSLTKRILEAGKILDIPLLDHVIVTKESYFSFKDEGIV